MLSTPRGPFLLSFFMSLTTYLSETKSELRHVSWPSRAQTLGYTATVIGVSIGVAVLLGAFDLIFNFILKLTLS